ncbi:glycosyl transferase family 1 [Iodidimonas nitroreducens]|uniref:Glycosyl transferase family 1 n=1 Tax=Iodidimonas nitroreducens TaxID=1236968 RepID=A0A5A7NCP5_9PROT|nr:glycosyl transferase family 1 [Iodidimonas nitroreducens]
MQVHIKELVGALKRRDHRIDMVGPKAQKTDGGRSLTGFLGDARAHMPAAFNEMLEAGYNLKAYRQLLHSARAHQPDILYERYNAFLLAGLWAKRSLGIPYLIEVNAPLCHERSLLGNLALKGPARRMERAVWQGADAVLPVSDALADYVRREQVPDDRITVIPNGVRTELFQSVRRGSLRREMGFADKIVFGFVGYVREWHGLDQVLHAFARLADPALHFLIIGEGPASAGLKAIASELGIGHQLTFTGARPHEDIPALLGVMDIALQPDVNDYASPLKLFEYLAAGCAIIAPDRPNIREILDDGKTALLIDPDHPDDLSRAITALATDFDLRKKLGAAACDLIGRRDYTWDGNARKVEAIAEKLLARGAAI